MAATKLITGKARMQYDLTKPHTGRMIDYWLGGSHNFEIDRQFADRVSQQWPVARQQAEAERGRTRAIVQFFYEHGIRSVIDFGSGLPTCENTHLAAQAIDPEIKVVYSDIDPVTVAYGQEILCDQPNVIYLPGNAIQPLTILDAPETRALLGDNRRVGFCCLTLVHLFSDEEVRACWKTLYDWAAPASFLGIMVPTEDWLTDPFLFKTVEFYRRANIWSNFRSPQELKKLFGDWKLTETGIQPVGMACFPNGDSVHTVPITYLMILHKE